MRKWIASTVLFYLIPACFAATAVAGTLQQYKDLDHWCIARNKWEDARRAGPFPPQPEGSFHYHHYCDAVRGLGNMYGAKNKKDFASNYDFAISNAKYVIGHVPADHHLLPLIYLLMGKTHYLAKRHAFAEAAYLKATQLDPSYAPIYAALGYLYSDTNRNDEAIKAIKAGLELDPTLKSMRNQAAKLGIKIEPLPPKPEAQPASISPRPDIPVQPNRREAETFNPPKNRPESPPVDKDVPIGSSINPWCRFCPAPANSPPATPGVIPNAAR